MYMALIIAGRHAPTRMNGLASACLLLLVVPGVTLMDFHAYIDFTWFVMCVHGC